MRTRLSSWQVKTQEEQETMKYVEVNFDTPAHVGSDEVIYKIDFPVDVQGFNIKAIKVKSLETIGFTVAILEEDGIDVLYQSVEETKYHYDVVDLVYKPNVKSFFVKVHNRGSLTTKFNIQIRGIEVK